MGGHVGSGASWMMDTRGDRSTTARSARLVPPDALLTTTTSAESVPSGAAARSTTMSTALDAPGARVPAVDDTLNGATTPEIDQFSGWREIRTVAADDLWLSTAYASDSVAFHFTWRLDQQGVSEILPLLEDILEPFDPRPHWAKLTAMAPERTRGRYPRADEFTALRSALDPDGIFSNRAWQS